MSPLGEGADGQLDLDKRVADLEERFTGFVVDGRPGAGRRSVSRDLLPAALLTDEAAAPSPDRFVRLSEVAEREIDWYWPGRIARANVVVLAGDGGVGKSTLAQEMGARVTRGQAPPGGAAGPVRGPDEDRVKALDEAQLAALVAAAPEGRDRLVIEFMAASGLRIGEALGVRWGDLDLREAVVFVSGQLQRGERTRTKTRTGERLVKLPAGLVAQLREQRLASSYSQDADPVFATRTGRPLSRHNVYRTITRSADRAGLPEWVSPHTLRHSYARRLLVAGVGIRMLATLLGHRDPAFTMRRYARFLPSDVHALDVDFLDAGRRLTL